MKIIAQNKKALFDYAVVDSLEAGIALSGDEVKSIRAGHVTLVGSFAHIHDGELYLVNVGITPYSHAYDKSKDTSRRSRKLLVRRSELNKLIGAVAQKGITLIPLKLYLNQKGRVKVEVGMCKHKKAHQKKEIARERDIARETRRELKGSYRY